MTSRSGRMSLNICFIQRSAVNGLRRRFAMAGATSAEALNPFAPRRLVGAGVHGQLPALPRDVLDAAYEAAVGLDNKLASENGCLRKVNESWPQFGSEPSMWARSAEAPIRQCPRSRRSVN
jgi:TRAP-type mannitol/chloroaromatic compound transport system substrate-binding protein